MSYVPRNVAAFCVWITNILLYVAKHHERWGISAPPDEFTEQAARLKELAEKCAKTEHTDMDIFNKNTLWKSAEKDARRYLQGMVMRNPNVTDEDRRMMGLPVRDTIRTPVGDPVGLPTAMVKYLNEGALELHIEHVDTTPYDKRANYGVKIAYDVFPMDAPLPAFEVHFRAGGGSFLGKTGGCFGMAIKRRTE